MKYIIFGAGEFGRKTVALLGKEKIICFFDNDPLKWNTCVEGIPVRSFGMFHELLDSTTLVIAVSSEKVGEIIGQIKDNGINNYILFEELVVEVRKSKLLARTDFIKIYEKTICWIMRYSVKDKGIINNTSLRKSYPEVTGYYIPTLLKWGYRDLAYSYARWLCSVQKTDGSWHNTEDTDPYIFDTAQVLKGLLAIRKIMPTVEKHILAGCDWILSRMREDGRLETPVTDSWGNDPNVCDEVIHIYCLSPLLEAAEVFSKPEYRNGALRIWNYYKQNYYDKIMNFGLLSHFYAYLMEALLDIGEWDMAKEAMHKMERYQKSDGSVPAYYDCDWICSAGLFQLSLVWFRLGNVDRGNRAFEYGCKLQNQSGGWFGSYLSEKKPSESNTYFPISEISWTPKFFLDALYEKCVAEFDMCYEEFLPHIEKSDGRYQILAKEIQSLAKNRENRILDAGCGKGRYLVNLMGEFPDNMYEAVDISPKVMECFSVESVEKRQGTLTNLPYEDAVFHIVYACESLEHAIDIENAIAEMSRVTKSGGKIIIIDKNIEALGKLEIGSWEQWFDVNRIKKIMEKYCKEVLTYRNIPYDGKVSDGLFCAWIGTVQ